MRDSGENPTAPLPPWASYEDQQLASMDAIRYGTVFCTLIDGKRVRVDPTLIVPSSR